MNNRTTFICIRLDKILWLFTAILVFLTGGYFYVNVRAARLEEIKYLYQARVSRDKLHEQSLKALKSIIDNPKASQAEKEKASLKYLKETEIIDKEARIEVMLKGKGYEEVLCQIDGDRTRVMIKSKKKLKSNDITYIELLLKDLYNLREVYIQTEGFRGSFYG